MVDSVEKDAKKKVKKSDDELTAWCLDQIEQIKDENEVLNSDRAESLRYYRGEPDIVQIVNGRSKVTTTDLMDCIEWVKPSLLEVFASGDDVVTLDPGNETSVAAVEKQHLLVNYQLKVKNNWFLILHDWFDDMLKMKTGTVKYQWYKHVEILDKEYEGLTENEYQAKKAEENVEIIAEKIIETPVPIPEGPEFAQLPGMIPPTIKTYNITARYTIEDEYPLIEACPAEDVGFSPRARELKDTFVYHRLKLKKWEFKKKYGKKAYENVKDTKTKLEENADSVVKERYEDLGGADFLYDKDKEHYFVFECYFRDKDSGDPKILTLCGEHKLDLIDNKYRKPPFHTITPIKMAHRVSGWSMYDLIKEIQQIRTALLRQIMDNLYFANNRRYFGDPGRLNLDDYLNNNFPGALIRTQGDPGTVVKPEENAPLPQEVFTFWEMLNVEKDYHSGVPRSFQGVNNDVLNKTFRGQNQQISQAGQRVSMMARLIAEMGVAPLVSDIVDLNIRFLKKKTAVRLMKSWVEISPENIIGKYDVIVNVGLGTAHKAEQIMNIQQLLGLYAQIFKTGVPIVTPNNVYNAMKELVKNMGFRNVGDFVTDPKFTQAVQGLVMMGIQAGGMMNPQVAPLLMELQRQLGMTPPQQKQIAGEAATFPGQQPPELPTQPAQPMNQQMPSQGGNF